MKFILLPAFLVLACFTISAQEESEPVRKGKIMVETGSSLVTGLSSGTGGNILFDEGATVTQLGIDIGKFVSEDFVIKLKLGILNSGGSTITNIAGGAKYYLGGVAPLEVNLGMITGFGSTEFIGNIHIGYAARLANNIYFEPKIGVLYSQDSTAGSVTLNFALLF